MVLVTAALQERLDLVALEGGVACFGSQSRTHAVALLDVVGAEAGLATADDATQEELLAGRAQFLNAQTAPFQVLVRAEPIDLEGHLRRVQARIDLLPEALRAIALDYLGFVQTLAHQRSLLERHCYVVLPDQRAEIPAVSVWRRMWRWLQRLAGRSGSSELADDHPDGISTSVSRRLQARADLVARQLGRSGLRTRRLDSRQVAELLHRCWSPELARVQRLREELSAYTTLVVGFRHRGHPKSVDNESVASESEVSPGGVDERLFELGTRTLADLIAPSGCEIRADHLRLDGSYTRVLVVTAYPRLVTAGWLSLLVETDLPIESSLHVRPLATVGMVRWLGVQIARLQSARLAALRGERIVDPERESAYICCCELGACASSTSSRGASKSSSTPCWRSHGGRSGNRSVAFGAARPKRATNSWCRATWTRARSRPRCHSSGRRWPWKPACSWAWIAPARRRCCWTHSTGHSTTPISR